MKKNMVKFIWFFPKRTELAKSRRTYPNRPRNFVCLNFKFIIYYSDHLSQLQGVSGLQGAGVTDNTKFSHVTNHIPILVIYIALVPSSAFLTHIGTNCCDPTVGAAILWILSCKSYIFCACQRVADKEHACNLHDIKPHNISSLLHSTCMNSNPQLK